MANPAAASTAQPTLSKRLSPYRRVSKQRQRNSFKTRPVMCKNPSQAAMMFNFVVREHHKKLLSSDEKVPSSVLWDFVDCKKTCSSSTKDADNRIPHLRQAIQPAKASIANGRPRAPADPMLPSSVEFRANSARRAYKLQPPMATRMEGHGARHVPNDHQRMNRWLENDMEREYVGDRKYRRPATPDGYSPPADHVRPRFDLADLYDPYIVHKRDESGDPASSYVQPPVRRFEPVRKYVDRDYDDIPAGHRCAGLADPSSARWSNRRERARWVQHFDDYGWGDEPMPHHGYSERAMRSGSVSPVDESYYRESLRSRPVDNDARDGYQPIQDERVPYSKPNTDRRIMRDEPPDVALWRELSRPRHEPSNGTYGSGVSVQCSYNAPPAPRPGDMGSSRRYISTGHVERCNAPPPPARQVTEPYGNTRSPGVEQYDRGSASVTPDFDRVGQRRAVPGDERPSSRHWLERSCRNSEPDYGQPAEYYSAIDERYYLRQPD